MCRSGSSPTITDCRFVGSHALEGGGLATLTSSNPRLIRCAFLNNVAVDGSGGGIFCNQSNPILVDCVLIGNDAEDGGGGLGCDYDAPAHLVRCEIAENTARRAAGVLCLDGSDAELDSCCLARNAAENFGGGLLCQDASPRIRSCTFASNSAYIGGGLACRFGSHATAENIIIAFSDAGRAVFCDAQSFAPALACTDIYGNAGGDWSDPIAGQLGSTGNISEDPLFCGEGSANRRYGLRSDSPCAQENNIECGQIGAFAVACSVASAVLPPTKRTTEKLCVALWSTAIAPRGAEIHYVLPPDVQVPVARLSIHDLCGGCVRKWDIPACRRRSGVVEWDADDDSGALVACGIYFIRLDVGESESHSHVMIAR